MTEQEKELLLKDLCARLPYDVKVFYEYVDDLDNKTYGYSLTSNTWCINEFVRDKAVIKPYLRPMESMTDEEQNELFKFYHNIELEEVKKSGNYLKAAYMSDNARYDWLNTHHFDFRGLIEKGLALEAPKGMYDNI